MAWGGEVVVIRRTEYESLIAASRYRRVDDSTRGVVVNDEELNAIEAKDYGTTFRTELESLIRALVAALRVEREANAKLRADILAIHESRIEEAEVWIDGPGEDTHRDLFPDCTDCEGHTVDVQVCSECGYNHDGDQATYRKWPCSTVTVAVASYPLNEDAK